MSETNQTVAAIRESPRTSRHKADLWMKGWVAGAADQTVPKPMRTDDYFQAGHLEGKTARQVAVQRVEGHYGVKPRR